MSEQAKAVRLNVMLAPEQIELVKGLAEVKGWSFSQTLRTVIEGDRTRIERVIRNTKRRKSAY